MDIVIEKIKVIDNLHRQSAQLGLKVQAPEIVASTADDEERIEPMWSGVTAELLAIMQPYANLTTNDATVTYHLAMPSNWSAEQSGNLALHCNAYLCNALVAMWMDAVKPDSANLFRALNKSNVETIEYILCQRKKPTRE